MSLLSRLARNSLWLLFARFGSQVCAVMVTYLLARRLGSAGFGEYSFIAAAIVIGNTFTTFGSDMYLIREIGAKSDFSRLSSALILQVVMSCLFIGIVFLATPYLPNQTPECILALRVYVFALIPLAFFTVLTSALRGRQKMDSYAGLNLVVSILQVLGILIFIQRGTDAVRLAFLLVGIQAMGALIAAGFCSSSFPGFWEQWRFRLNEIIELFAACIPVALISILGILYQRSSLAMLSFLGSASMVGWFSVGIRVIEATRIGHIAALTALYPAMASAKVTKDSIRAFQLSWSLLLVIAGTWTLILSCFAGPMVEILFGKEYRPSIPVLRILSFTLIPYTINSFLSVAFLVEKGEKVVVRAVFVSLIILLLLNLWLIPRAEQIGAAWALLVAEALQSCWFLIERKYNPIPSPQNSVQGRGVSYDLSDLSR